ncbi:MAG: hypothetical protein QXW60_03575 [Nitrososphaerota archaeon]
MSKGNNQEVRRKCPYCNALFETPRDLSKHINQAHIGKGLLEGDRSKW